MEKTKRQELEVLNGYYNSGANQIVIVYGHVSTGSETVIDAFVEGKECILYSACSASERLQQNLIGEHIRKRGYDVSEYPSYREIFEAVEKYSIDLDKPLVLMINHSSKQ